MKCKFKVELTMYVAVSMVERTGLYEYDEVDERQE